MQTPQQIAAAILAANRAKRCLVEFIPIVTHKWVRPMHLRLYAEVLERSMREPVRCVLSAPPRHGKSETTLHGVVQRLVLQPTARIAYVTYAAEFAQKQARKARLIAERAGIKFSQIRANYWVTEAGGIVSWTSIGGQITGEGFDLLLVDDPVKDRVEAESGTYRERAWEWFGDVAMTRLEPGGSAIVMQTRWHPDDLAGRLIALGWPIINLKAINDDGEALWPDRYPVEALEEIRRGPGGEYGWASLYQGEPRPRGGAVFRDVHFYDKAPESGYRAAIGGDFAYTSKTYADANCAIVMLRHGDTFYVVDVRKERVESPQFARTLKALQGAYPVPVSAYIGGTEKGVVDFLKAAGVRVDAKPATAHGDKFARAQPVASAWNTGKVLLPKNAAWANDFLNEVLGFTGVNDKHDDQVDALASAYDALTKPPPARGMGQNPILPF